MLFVLCLMVVSGTAFQEEDSLLELFERPKNR